MQLVDRIAKEARKHAKTYLGASEPTYGQISTYVDLAITTLHVTDAELHAALKPASTIPGMSTIGVACLKVAGGRL